MIRLHITLFTWNAPSRTTKTVIALLLLARSRSRGDRDRDRDRDRERTQHRIGGANIKAETMQPAHLCPSLPLLQIGGYVCGTLAAGDTLTHESMSGHDPAGKLLCGDNPLCHTTIIPSNCQQRHSIQSPKRRTKYSMQRIHMDPVTDAMNRLNRATLLTQC
jgi:hypothetical protein